MTGWMEMEAGILALTFGACFFAGAVRGFTGFGLSALAMAILAPVLTPLALIPVFWFLEMAASLVLMKGGWADADRSSALRLVVAAGIGLPFGLLLTMTFDPDLSRTVALALLICLASAQLARLRLPVLATPGGTAAAGFGAGLATGLASVGGMVIALYALVRDLPARTMRGTLNIYMLGAGAVGLVTHLALGTMDGTAAARGLALVPVTLAGVFVGKALFTPRWERYYKRVCLVLLLGLAGAGLIRVWWGAA